LLSSRNCNDPHQETRPRGTVQKSMAFSSWSAPHPASGTSSRKSRIHSIPKIASPSGTCWGQSCIWARGTRRRTPKCKKRYPPSACTASDQLSWHRRCYRSFAKQRQAQTHGHRPISDGPRHPSTRSQMT